MPSSCPVVQDFPVRHVLDVIHIEKNIANSVLKFIFGEKDTSESRRDLQALGVRRKLWLRPDIHKATNTVCAIGGGEKIVC